VPASDCIDDELVVRIDAINATVCASQLKMLQLLAEADDRGTAWEDWGAQDMCHWISMRYGVSYYRAERWIAAAHALRGFPLIRQAFERGDLSLDKVVELTRFATTETEEALVEWAQRVSAGRIRHKAELLRKAEPDEAAQTDRDRSVRWTYYDDGRRFGLTADLPAADGAVVIRALDRMARQVPELPEETTWGIEARRADALVTMCSGSIASDPDPDRATVILHARVGGGGAEGVGPASLHSTELEGGPVLHPQVAERLLCDARVQVILEDGAGQVVRLGRMRRDPPEWMLRQLRYRDRECAFPGCAQRRHVHAHHVTWWDRGGSTDLDNLVLICSFHHKLVHEYGWSLTRGRDGAVRWFHPDGTRYRAGPGLELESEPSEQNHPRETQGVFRLSFLLKHQVNGRKEHDGCPS
jgi:hypothetical protein